MIQSEQVIQFYFLSGIVLRMLILCHKFDFYLVSVSHSVGDRPLVKSIEGNFVCQKALRKPQGRIFQVPHFQELRSDFWESDLFYVRRYTFNLNGKLVFLLASIEVQGCTLNCFLKILVEFRSLGQVLLVFLKCQPLLGHLRTRRSRRNHILACLLRL